MEGMEAVSMTKKRDMLNTLVSVNIVNVLTDARKLDIFLWCRILKYINTSVSSVARFFPYLLANQKDITVQKIYFRPMRVLQNIILIPPYL